MKWFEVDKDGLAKILQERGLKFLVYELVQNALDENTKVIHVDLKWADGIATIRVEDDNPTGFENLKHAWTMFAESPKKGDPTKRGRYDLGEKLVLALCRKAMITSTKGRVTFDDEGRKQTSTKTAVGSVFEGEIKMLKRDFDPLIEAAHSVIVPEHVVLNINGEEVDPPKRVDEFPVEGLDTVIANDEGVLTRSKRNTVIRLYEIRGTEKQAMLHEMGIPVCPLEDGDKWHVDVGQRVPITLDRQNVAPAFLRKVRLAVLNHQHSKLTTPQDANAGWAREAMKEDDVDPEAVKHLMDLRFGEKRVAFDPSDKEANSLAVSKGYTLVYGRQLSTEEWANAKKAEAILPAGKVTPSSKVLSVAGGEDDTYPEEKRTPNMRKILAMTEAIGSLLLEKPIRAHLANRFEENANAWYGGRVLSYNVARLGRAWFEEYADPLDPNFLRLLIHELGHESSDNHLSREYHDALCKLGARLAGLVQKEPAVFRLETYSNPVRPADTMEGSPQEATP